MSTYQHDMTVRAELTVLVSRNARGDLYDGVRDRLRKIADVHRVDDVEIRGLQPGLNDLTVDVRARLVVRADGHDVTADSDAVDADDVASRLAAGFGIKHAAVTADSQTGIS
ncbi:hypothetical protein SAMN04487949_3023 [Halogranum gelatinilyticum]|uniref:Uncharacterized protein n=1 Tax=Halogranum gelatinilyticum TaxID=660521 RepID=A0A1G9XJY5_9EURY|nr:hypothetical protein [Halogranum gelatinilyticum]SDM97060.1 hypothetical protein SAMN04487949_3023 [Halogranum gelatinilyticum]